MDPIESPFEDVGEHREEEAAYVCQSCGEEIVVPVDLSMGEEQEYSEDCPVCCRPHLLRLAWDGGGWRIDAIAE